MKALLVLIATLLPAAALAAEPVRDASAVRDTSYIANGSRVLRDEAIVAAPAADVFAAFTTEEGWRAWATPFVKMSQPKLSEGMEIESAYKLDGKLGDETNIHHRVLAFIPDRMFAFRVAAAPKGFPYPAEVSRIFSVAEFEPIDAKHTRVRLSMIGYGEGKGFDGLYAFFAKDNPWAMGQLVKRFETGPADWKKLLAKVPSN